MTVLLLTATFVFAAIAVGAISVLLIVVGDVQRTQARLRAYADRPLLRLHWVEDIPVARIEAGDPAEVGLWLEAVATNGPVIHA